MPPINASRSCQKVTKKSPRLLQVCLSCFKCSSESLNSSHKLSSLSPVISINPPTFRYPHQQNISLEKEGDTIKLFSFSFTPKFKKLPSGQPSKYFMRFFLILCV